MNTTKTFLFAGTVIVFSAAGITANSEAQSTTEGRAAMGTEKPIRPDNTGINERDVQERRPTSFNQGSSEAATERTRQIREELVRSRDLSTYAENVKIVTDDTGFVVLRGPVRSIAERDQIGAIASRIAGSGRVANELEIVPAK